MRRASPSSVKFHWNPLAGTHSLGMGRSGEDHPAPIPISTAAICGKPSRRATYPEWELGVQLFTEDEAEKFSFDVLDSTKLVPEELVAVRPLGRMVLNRNPDNFFAETEQVAFCTAHVVPGIDFSNDPLLAGRHHSYLDTQISRLGGANFHEIPINSPLAAVHNNQRDGLHRQAIPRGRVAYEPNSLGGGCPFQAGMKGFASFPKAVEPDNAPVDKVRGKPEKFAEHYNQATLFFESQTPVEREHILRAFRFELSKVTIPAIRQRMVSGLRNVSEELATELAVALGFDLPEAMPRAAAVVPAAEIASSPALSLTALPGEGGIRTRKIAMLVADGIEGEPLVSVLKALTDAGAVVRFLSNRLGRVTAVDGSTFEVDATLENSPPVLFDALVLPDGIDAVEKLSKDGHTLEFLKDQYRHCKSILVLGASSKLLKKAGIFEVLPSGEPDLGLLVAKPSGYDAAAQGFVAAIAKHRHAQRDTDPPLV